MLIGDGQYGHVKWSQKSVLLLFMQVFDFSDMLLLCATTYSPAINQWALSTILPVSTEQASGVLQSIKCVYSVLHKISRLLVVEEKLFVLMGGPRT